MNNLRFSVLSISMIVFFQVIMMWIVSLNEAIAASIPLSKQSLMVVQVELGNDQGELKFSPKHLKFQTGKRYELVTISDITEVHANHGEAFNSALRRRATAYRRRQNYSEEDHPCHGSGFYQ